MKTLTRAVRCLPILLSLLPGCTQLDLMTLPRHPDAPHAVIRLVECDASALKESERDVISLGERAMPEMFEQLGYVDAQGRLRILDTALMIAKPESILVAILERAATDKDASIRRAVAMKAATLQPPPEQTISTVRLLLYDRDATVRAAALTTLGGFAPAAETLSSEELVQLSSDPELIVAATASAVAMKRGYSAEIKAVANASIPRLTEGLSSSSPTERAMAAYALGRYGRGAESAVRPLTSLTKHSEVPEVRLQAAIALVRIGTGPARRAAIPVLESFIESSDPRMRKAAAASLRAVSKR
jgi:HEAT repeat protein